MMEIITKINLGSKNNEGYHYINEIIRKQKCENKIYSAQDELLSNVTMAERTASCIQNSVMTALNPYRDTDLCKMFSKNNIDFTSIAKEKTILFVISSDLDDSLYRVSQMMYKYISKEIYEYADEKCAHLNNMTPIHVRFIIDDFAAGCREENIENKLANCRSRNISYILSLQSIAQLEALYGGESTKYT